MAKLGKQSKFFLALIIIISAVSLFFGLSADQTLTRSSEVRKRPAADHQLVRFQNRTVSPAQQHQQTQRTNLSNRSNAHIAREKEQHHTCAWNATHSVSDHCTIPSAVLLKKPLWVQHAVRRKCSNQIYTIPPANKRIWMYWDKGWETAPEVPQAVRQTWRINNPGWEIMNLSNANLQEFVTDDDILPNLNSLGGLKAFTVQARSDLLRLALLGKYGGVWADATAFCVVPLDLYLPYLVTEELRFLAPQFVATFKLLEFIPSAIETPNQQRPIASWWLYGEKNSVLLLEWRRQVQDYWKQRRSPQAHTYYWVHYMLHKALWEHATLAKLWEQSLFLDQGNVFQQYVVGRTDIVPECLPATVFKTKTAFPVYFHEPGKPGYYLFNTYRAFCQRFNCLEDRECLFSKMVHVSCFDKLP